MDETPEEHSRPNLRMRMHQAYAQRSAGARAARRPLLALARPQSLSVRLLVLTALFVMVCEALIYVPSIARFREGWLESRLNAAYIATLALKASPQWSVSDTLRRDLLAHSGVKAVSVKRKARRDLMLQSDMTQMPALFVDLPEASQIELIAQAFDTLLAGDGRIVRAAGVPEMMEDGDAPVIDIVFDETMLRRAMLRYSKNLFALSLVISLMTGALVYFSLHWFLVRPMRRLTDNMVRFRDDPEDASRVIVPSPRGDEIGIAERALGAMQSDVRSALHQKNRLAALGAAVAKINHDLRNMLTAAQLFSDRVAASSDPMVQKHLPKLMKALDRAVTLTTETLRFGRAEEEVPRPRAFVLAQLAEEVAAALPGAPGLTVSWKSEIARDLALEADPDQVYRILLNLARNSAQALEAARRDGTVTLRAHRPGDGASVVIEIEDDGPGIPQAVRAHLFEAFASARPSGGTGLGLAISRELARAHGGDIMLVKSDAAGTLFRVILPDRARFH